MTMIKAEPYAFALEPAHAALLIIDMQRDFVEPGGFGEALGNDVSLLRKAIRPTRRVLEAARKAGLLVIHTREGHRPDLSDLAPAKKARGKLKFGIGDKGPMGRILVRGEYGHDIIDELKPKAGEPVVDKSGKGAFYATDLDAMLKSRGIRQLVVCGVTTEVCVNTTVREANDRGYDCLVLEDCVASYFPEFQEYALVRWTETRNMEAFLKLLADRKLDLHGLITHRFPIARAHSAYDLITGKTQDAFLGVLISYPQNADNTRHVNIAGPDRPVAAHKPVQVGLLGAGSFAIGTMLPALKRVRRVGVGCGERGQWLAPRYAARRNLDFVPAPRMSGKFSTIRRSIPLSSPPAIICTRAGDHRPQIRQARLLRKTSLPE